MYTEIDGWIDRSGAYIHHTHESIIYKLGIITWTLRSIQTRRRSLWEKYDILKQKITIIIIIIKIQHHHHQHPHHHRRHQHHSNHHNWPGDPGVTTFSLSIFLKIILTYNLEGRINIIQPTDIINSYNHNHHHHTIVIITIIAPSSPYS